MQSHLQEGLAESLVLPIDRMSYNEPEQTFILLDREPNSLEFGHVIPTLRFTVKEIDPSTGEWLQSDRKPLTLRKLHSIVIGPTQTFGAHVNVHM